VADLALSDRALVFDTSVGGIFNDAE